MTDIVLDASTVLKWVLTENDRETEDVRKVQEQIIGGKIRAMVPEFLFTEVINVLFWKKKLSESEILNFLEEIKDGRLQVVSMDKFEDGEMLEAMKKYQISVYDAYYVVLAKRYKCKLLSFDEKLKRIGE